MNISYELEEVALRFKSNPHRLYQMVAAILFVVSASLCAGDNGETFGRIYDFAIGIAKASKRNLN